MKAKKKTILTTLIIVVAVCLIAFGVFLFLLDYGLSIFEPEHKEDIVIPLGSDKGTLIIREWSMLQNGGVEFYYKEEWWKKEIHLGGGTVGNGYYFPFAEGLYDVSVDENQVTIAWARVGPTTDKDRWDKVTYELPVD